MEDPSVDEAEFDKFVDEYHSLHAANIAVSGEEPEYFAEYKVRDLAREYDARCRGGRRPPSILDFGSGLGASVPFIREHLPDAQITCLDVSAKSIAIGESRWCDFAQFVLFDGVHIPLPDSSVDIVFAGCVFHHIDDQDHIILLREFHRVLVPKGMVFIFEHNPYNPLTVHAVSTCPFDKNAKLIPALRMRDRLRTASFAKAKIRYRVFFPRQLSPLRPLEKWLTWAPFGAQYYVSAVKD
jgi:ubiquinone/menaquinone biosynthesis C-methylase UbiE